MQKLTTLFTLEQLPVVVLRSKSGSVLSNPSAIKRDLFKPVSMILTATNIGLLKALIVCMKSQDELFGTSVRTICKRRELSTCVVSLTASGIGLS